MDVSLNLGAFSSEVGSYTSTNAKWSGKRCVSSSFGAGIQLMPVKSPSVSQRSSTPLKGVEFVYPVSTIIGANRGFTVIEAEREADIHRAVRGWLDLCTFDIYPIMRSEEAVKA